MVRFMGLLQVVLIVVCVPIPCECTTSITYMMRLQSCALSGVDHQTVSGSELECHLECLERFGKCAAYHWNGTSGLCQIQHKLNVMAGTSLSDTINVITTGHPDHSNVITCNNPDACPVDHLCLNPECPGLNRTCVAPDCSEILAADPSSSSGVYPIAVSGSVRQVFCDMDTDGGGWTVFLSRLDGSVDFNQNFSVYQQGFGEASGEYWLGLDALHAVTTFRTYQLRADISDWEDEFVHTLYASILVGNNNPQMYKLTLGAFLGGEGGHAFAVNNNMYFSTYDLDRDNLAGSCALNSHGGWWFNQCCAVYPTSPYVMGGEYPAGTIDNTRGMQWRTWPKHATTTYFMKTIQLKLRP